MNKLHEKILSIAAVSFISSYAYAAEAESAGDLIFKLKGKYVVTESKIKEMPKAVNANFSPPSKLSNNGMGIEASVNFFIIHNFAIELATGVDYFKAKKTSISDAANAYGADNGVNKKNTEIFMIPAIATLQYHIAPYGAIRPYVGVGYGFTTPLIRSNAFSIALGHGMVSQAGVDVVFKNDSIITLDVKYQMIEHKISYSNTYLGRRDPLLPTIKGKLRANPISISIGYGFKL